MGGIGVRAGAALLVWAAASPFADAQEMVRVYTNADLEALPPLPTSEPAPARESGGWEGVQEFLAEQYARIDANRAYELDLAVTEETVRRSQEESRPHYTLPFSYYGYGYGSGYGPGFGVHRRGHHPPRVAAPVAARPGLLRETLLRPRHRLPGGRPMR